ncbi:unnamed protein product [Blepharisma stoltei]|uniref:VWFA domain-containing protein n=1 Tax=Blepharisma stoltei TaxID=1481888 RepID=A0AAU9IMI3_9CILI|nr:unnamed protein product [Blepharisma stoltei]
MSSNQSSNPPSNPPQVDLLSDLFDSSQPAAQPQNTNILSSIDVDLFQVPQQSSSNQANINLYQVPQQSNINYSNISPFQAPQQSNINQTSLLDADLFGVPQQSNTNQSSISSSDPFAGLQQPNFTYSTFNQTLPDLNLTESFNIDLSSQVENIQINDDAFQQISSLQNQQYNYPPQMQYLPQQMMYQPSPYLSYNSSSNFSLSPAQYSAAPEPLIMNDDDEIQLRTVVEETKTPEEAITVSMNFLLNYLELKNTEEEIPCTLSLRGSSAQVADIQKNRQGLDLICVVDVSGSMSGVKLELVKKTLNFMLTLLNDGDRVSIVVFSDNAQRIIKLTAINEVGKVEVERAINNMNIIGSTNIVSGLEKGLKVASDRRIVNQVTSILLLSDGCDDSGDTVLSRAAGCSNEFKSLIKSSYTVHTFGYGADHDAKVMQEIARSNSGNFYYVEDPKDIPIAFANCFGELASLVADKIQVALITQPCSIPFHLSKVYSENGDSNFSMAQVHAGDKKDSVFLLKFPPITDRVPDNEIIRPVKARISYETNLGENKIIETELTILVVNEGREEIEVNEDVMVNYYRCLGAEILKEVASLAESHKYNEAKEAAIKAANEFKGCIVNDHPIVKALIRDLEDAANRASSYSSWEQGGRAQVFSVQSSHFAQKASNNAMMYQNGCQAAYSEMAMDYFSKP